jgi:hypothetical protein
MACITVNSGEKVLKNLSFVCLATMMPLGSVALAQSATPASSAELSRDAGAYPLKGGTSQAPNPATQSSDGAMYELSGTNISGTQKYPQPILTAPFGQGLPLKFENGIHVHPTVSASLGYNDNLLSNNTNSLKSSFVNVTPQLMAELRHKGDRYTALAVLNSRRYNESAADNSDDSRVEIAGDNYFDARARAGWSAGLVNSTDVRGSNNRPLTAEAARWHSTNLNGRFIYGAPEAPGRVEFDLGNQDKVYDNERAITAVGDVATTSYAGRVFYRLGTRSLALAEFRNAKASYNSSASDSNTERRYYLGLTWEATAATTGIVKIGQMTKDFDLAGRQDFSGASWEANVRWLPLTYSAVDLLASRSTFDATGFGSYNLVTNTSVTWSHKWNQSLGSRLNLGWMNTEFGGTTRQDSAFNFGFAVNYELYRWLKIGVDFARTNNTSTTAGYEFNRNMTMLTLDAAL